jgi:hypothetical protein
LSLLAHLIAGLKIEPKGLSFGPKIGLTLSLSARLNILNIEELGSILSLKRLFEIGYLYNRLHEFIVTFNIIFFKESPTYDDTILLFSDFTYKISRILSLPKNVTSYVDDPFKFFKLHKKFMQPIFQVYQKFNE